MAASSATRSTGGSADARRLPGSGQPSSVTRCVCTSFGMSISTGPGRPDSAISNASGTTSSSLRASRSAKLCLVIGTVSPYVSTSWKASLPIMALGT
jgi:hypothetical protein